MPLYTLTFSCNVNFYFVDCKKILNTFKYKYKYQNVSLGVGVDLRGELLRSKCTVRGGLDTYG